MLRSETTRNKIQPFKFQPFYSMSNYVLFSLCHIWPARSAYVIHRVALIRLLTNHQWTVSDTLTRCVTSWWLTMSWWLTRWLTCKTSDVIGVKNLTLMRANTVGRSPFRALANDNLSKPWSMSITSITFARFNHNNNNSWLWFYAFVIW